MMQTVVLERITQRLRNRLLARNFLKSLRPPFSSNDLIGHGLKDKGKRRKDKGERLKEEGKRGKGGGGNGEAIRCTDAADIAESTIDFSEFAVIRLKCVSI